MAANGSEKSYDSAHQEVLDYAERLFGRLPVPRQTKLVSQLLHYDDVRDGRKVNRYLDYEPPMHRHPVSIIRSNPGIQKLIQVASQMAPERQAGEKFQKIMSIYNAANALKLINRFIDRRQDPLLEYPRQPDGSDLWNTAINPKVSENLVYERRLQRLWIRFLHRKGLHQYARREGNRAAQEVKLLQALHQIYMVGRVFLEDEIRRIPADQTRRLGPRDYIDMYAIDWDDPASNIFSWMERTRAVLLIVLDRMKNVALTPRPSLAARFTGGPAPPGPELTPDQLLEQNLGDTRILNRMIITYEELLKSAPFARLLVDLLSKEDRFEKALTVEHVEDKLINKQILMQDEATYLNELNVMTDAAPLFEKGYKGEWEFLYEVLGDIALVNRQRRNFRLFRDWHPGLRPWKSMYQLYDSTTPGNQWIANAVSEWNANLRTNATPGDNPLHEGRTGYKRLGEDLFGIRPIDYTPTRALSAAMLPCGVCHQHFVGGDSMDSTIVQLVCKHDHIFHLKCIFKFWDAPGKYLYTCPTCKKAPLLNFQHLGINPDDPAIAPDWQQNTFGWDDAGRYRNRVNTIARSLYDVPEKPTSLAEVNVSNRGSYWVRENMHIVGMMEQADWINWSALLVPPEGLRPFRNDPMVGNPHRNVPPSLQQRILRGWSLTGHEWMQRYRGANRQPPPAQATSIPPPRFAPQAEMAYLRMRRRQRDANRRRNIEQRRLGLAGLFP